MAGVELGEEMNEESSRRSRCAGEGGVRLGEQREETDEADGGGESTLIGD